MKIHSKKDCNYTSLRIRDQVSNQKPNDDEEDDNDVGQVNIEL